MPKTIVTVPTSLRPVLVSFAREGRDEQHIMPFPDRGQLDKNAKSHRPAPICPQFTTSVNRSRSFALGVYWRLLFRCHRSRGRDVVADQISEPARKLAKAQISCCNIRHNRI